MKTNLSAHITLNRISTKYYKPANAYERSVLTRLEKIPTDIYETVEEGACHIAQEIAQTIQEKQRAGHFCVMALTGGNSPLSIFNELIRLHKEEKLSFRNVIIFNVYEYYPLHPDTGYSSFRSLKELFLDHIDIDLRNVYTPDGGIPKEAILEHCRMYEQRIESFGGIDIMLLGIGRMGNIAFNEPGSQINSRTRLILIDNTSRSEAAKRFGNADNVPSCSITMGIKTILSPTERAMMGTEYCGDSHHIFPFESFHDDFPCILLVPVFDLFFGQQTCKWNRTVERICVRRSVTWKFPLALRPARCIWGVGMHYPPDLFESPVKLQMREHV